MLKGLWEANIVSISALKMPSAEYQKVNATASTGEHVSGESASGGSPPSDVKSGDGSWISRHLPFLKTKRGIAITVSVLLLIIGGGLAGLAALPKKGNKSANGAGGGEGNLGDSITSDEHFYGQSPPVYPSRTYRHSIPDLLSVWAQYRQKDAD